MELFKELTQLHGVSGYEREVREFIKGKAAPYADEITEDAIGNLIVLKKGSAPDKKKIMLAAHMDEIGVQVIKIEENGMIMIKSLGCSWIYTAYQSRVQFRNGTIGVIASRVRPEQIDNKFVNLYVDIGVSSKEEVLKYVDVGDVGVYMGPYAELAGEFITAKAIDDRVGCYMLLETLKNLKEVKNDIYFVFTVQEEEGCRGSKVTAERIQPDLGVAVDVTPGMDRPGDLEGSNTPGNGTAIKISDTSVICDEYLVEKMIDCCKREQIKYQKDVIYVGGTDASSINLSHYGVKAAGISVVTRYTHGPNAIVNKDDIRASIALLTGFVNESFEF
ncbi:MAG TPA: M42 family metallopeptidase [Candidatus Pelethocola excrementipullorum]|nr:M42 family metallopeptidase [Candidatus Pelethocola excrementipullorum]